MTPYVVFHYVLPASAAAVGIFGYLFARFVMLPRYGGSAKSLVLPHHNPTTSPGE